MNRLWHENFRLEVGKIALSRQIEQLIIAEINKGVRPQKLRMPSIRELSQTLMDVNEMKNLFHAVEEAYKNLCKAGILYTKRSIGTFINPDAFPDECHEKPPKQIAGFSFDKEELLENEFITIGPQYANGGAFTLPKPSLLYEELYQLSAVRLDLSNSNPYQYLLPVVHREVRNRSFDVHSSHLAIIPGVGMALKIVLLSLLKREEKVIISAKCNARVKELIRMTGAEIIEIESDQQGIRMTEIEAHCIASPIKLVYVEPAAQYPDTVHLTANRRDRLLQLSELYKFAIIEHNEEYGCYYSPPTRSLFDKDKKARVIYISSLSRHIPWLHNIGFVLAPKNFIDQLYVKSRYLYENWDIYFEKALVRLLEKGLFHNISRKLNSSLATIRKKTDKLFYSMQLNKFAVLSNTRAGIFIFIHFMMDISTLIPKLIDSGFYDPPDRYSIPQREIRGLRISLYFGSLTRFNNLFKVLKTHFMNP